MKSQVVILALLFASVSALTGTSCACSEIKVQADCTGGGCAWVTINGSGSCQGSTITKAACNTYTTQSKCDSWAGCAWTNAGACADFTKCEDYTVDSVAGSLCQSKDSTCIPGTVTSGKVVCKAGTLSCGDVTDADVCKSGLMASSTSTCWWISSKCASQDVSKCTTITDQTVCQNMGCVYGTACAAPKCSDQIQAACGRLRTDDVTMSQACKWGTTACADVDATTLTQANCASDSQYLYAWNGSACSACTGQSSSYSMLLAFIGMLALLLF